MRDPPNRGMPFRVNIVPIVDTCYVSWRPDAAEHNGSPSGE
jgi:hypothetical protein